MLQIFSNFVIKNTGKKCVKSLQFPSMCFLFQKAQTYHAYVKISLEPRKFGREIVRTVFHNHLHFPVVNFIPVAKNMLAISGDLRAISVSPVEAGTLERGQLRRRSRDYDLVVESDSFHLCKVPLANRELLALEYSLEMICLKK